MTNRMVYINSSSQNLIFIYISLFLFFSPLQAQSLGESELYQDSVNIVSWQISTSNGDRLEVSGVQIINDDSLRIASNGSERYISIELIEKIKIKRSKNKKSIIYGAGIGIVVGFFWAAAAITPGEIYSSSDNLDDFGRFILRAGSTVVGATTGLIVGAKDKNHDMTGWHIDKKRTKIQEIMFGDIVLAKADQQIIAQDKSMQFGVKAGLNLSNISEDPEEVSRIYATKLAVGGIMLYPLSEVLDLQVEVMNLRKGTRGDEIITFSYLSVPVMARYNLGSGDSSPYIVLGPEFGFLLSAKSRFYTQVEVSKDNFKSMDLGLNVGAGVSRNMGAVSMFGDVRYSLGLFNINDEEGNNATIKTTGIQLFVGMMF